MFCLRRTALRAALFAAKPSPSLVVPKTRTFVSLNQSKLRPVKQWTSSSIQRRFASEDVAATERPTEEALEEKVSETESAEPAQVVEEVVENTTSEDTTMESTPETSNPSSTSSSPADAAGAIAGAAATGVAAAAAAAPLRPASRAAQFGGQPAPNNTLYVGNLFFEVSPQALEDYFARYGTIKKTNIVYDARGLSKGFGYVEFGNIDEAARAIEGANQQVFQGRRLAVQFHRARTPINRARPGGNPPSKTLFIGNMSFEMSDKDLSDLFREVRNVIDVRIAIDRRTGQPRGFAHADFIDEASATKAMDFLKTKQLYGRQLRVDYSLSTPRSAQPGN